MNTTLDSVNPVEWKFPEYVRATFEPLEDITAYELAQLMPFFIGKSLTEDDWKLLGTAVRHLKRQTIP